MGLRPEYSLVHSRYNAFLFAAVGEEKSGLPLTVLSALARQGRFDGVVTSEIQAAGYRVVDRGANAGV